MMVTRNLLSQLPTLALEPEYLDVLPSAKAFKTKLLEAIAGATQRIYLVALYLEDDDAGREIMDALYAAKQRNPELDIKVCVDWHRAQRGLIGAAASEGNAEMYKHYVSQHSHKVPVYGIPVRGREVFGVLHLKGYIIDDEVIYSGASLNNIYLHQAERYRYDRYHVIKHSALADSMVEFVQKVMIDHPAVNDLTCPSKPQTKQIKSIIRQFRSTLARAEYRFKPQTVSDQQVAITPIVGLGNKRNKLNKTIVQLIAAAKKEVFICTPYFNFPRSVAKEIRRALKRGVHVTIVVGDKTANDFYISPEEEFKTIGGVPYLYEMNLRRFAKAHESHIASRKLSIRLWKHGSNSYHLKGMTIDDRYMLITGNNINPRAWKLDLENAILIQDQHHHLRDKFQQEQEQILEHTQLICTYKQIEKADQYPIPAQRLIRKIKRVRADGLLKQLL